MNKEQNVLRANNLRRRLCIASLLGGLALCLMCGGPGIRDAVAETYMNGGLTVSEIPQPTTQTGGSSQHGYQVFRFRVTNNRNETLQVGLETQVGFSGHGLRLSRVGRTIEVGPKSEAILSLPIPAVDSGYASDARVAINGRVQRDRLPLEITHERQSYNRIQGTLLASKTLGASGADSLRGEVPEEEEESGYSFHYSGYSAQRTVFRSQHPMSEWADHWLAYSRYDGVVVARADLTGQAPSRVLDALHRYVECGGSLTVLDNSGNAWTPPKEWHATELTGEGRLGDDSTTVYSVGFGRVFSLPNNTVTPTVEEFWRQQAGQSWNFEEDSANTSMPVIEEYSVPVRGLIALMILFAAVIGPGNIVLLKYLKRRIWLLWTVPAISFVTSGLVFGYAILAEGVQTDRLTDTLTVLDQRTNHATTLGVTAYYAPLTPRRGLQFSSDTEVIPPQSNYAERSLTLDWTGGQLLRSGWVQARVPSHLALRKNETRRERVNVTFGEEAVTAVNGLGVPIKTLCVADSDGNVFVATDLEAGEKAVLVESDMKANMQLPVLLERIVMSSSGPLPWANISNRVVSPGASPQELMNRGMAPNTYVAVLDTTSPFIMPGLEGSDEGDSRGLVIGILESAEE